MLGRVLAIYILGAMVAAIAGMTLFGWTTQEIGELPSAVGIGTGFFLTAIVLAYVIRWMRTNWTEQLLLPKSLRRSSLRRSSPRIDQ